MYHFIVSEFVFVYSVKQILVIRDADNLPNHGQIILDLEYKLDRQAHDARSFTRSPAWHTASDNDIKYYQQKLSENLSNIALPARALLCRNPLCSDVNHLAMLNNYTGQDTEACLEAACCIISFSGSSYD